MSSIQEQIKALQRRQALIDQYRKALEAVCALPKHPEFEDLNDEVFQDLDAYVTDRIFGLENPDTKPKTVEKITSDALAPDEIETLRALLRRLAEKKAADEASSVVPAPTRTNAPPIGDRNDKLRFAMANQHLANKRVKVHTPDGIVGGVVRGLDAPHVVVQVDTGPTVSVELEQIEVA